MTPFKNANLSNHNEMLTLDPKIMTEYWNINRPPLTLKHGHNKTVAVNVSVYAIAPASVLPLSHWLHVFVNNPHIKFVWQADFYSILWCVAPIYLLLLSPIGMKFDFLVSLTFLLHWVVDNIFYSQMPILNNYIMMILHMIWFYYFNFMIWKIIFSLVKILENRGRVGEKWRHQQEEGVVEGWQRERRGV